MRCTRPSLFLVERSLPGVGAEDLLACRMALVESCRRLSRRGRPIRYLRSTLAPAEGRCFCLFEAGGVETVRVANETAQFPFARVYAVVELPVTEAGTVV
ncbi:MAG TPA: nickel-binding protein [Candidatus Dormibacteraeota bacterium]|nr:nickel-binding protein [Candidatus Dormibacteraeota bacterium]